MNVIKNKLFMAMIAVVGCASVFVPVPVAAQCVGSQCARDGADVTVTADINTTLEDSIQNVINVLLFLVAVVSVIMLIIGGLRYSTSNGNAEQIKAAKNIILYAIIGVIVAIMSYAIVDFVIDSF